MMMMFRSLTVLLALSLGASLAPAQEKPADESAPVKKPGEASDEATNAKDENQADAPKPGTTVTLLEPGEAPRAELRYHAGVDATLVLGVRSVSEPMVMGTRFPPTRNPEVRFTIESTSSGASDSGDMSLRLRFVDVDVVPDPRVPPPSLQVAQRTTGVMRGRSAELVVSDRGVVRSMKIDGAEVRPGGLIMSDIVEAMREALRSALVVLPEEAVGVGARWRVDSFREIGGVKMTERLEYRVTGIQGGAIRLAVETTRSAKEQTLPMPGSPQGMTLQSYTSTGKGVETISLDQLLPVESQREDKAEMEIAVTSRAGASHTMQQTMEMWTTIEPAPKRTDDSESKPRPAERP